MIDPFSNLSTTIMGSMTKLCHISIVSVHLCGPCCVVSSRIVVFNRVLSFACFVFGHLHQHFLQTVKMPPTRSTKTSKTSAKNATAKNITLVKTVNTRPKRNINPKCSSGHFEMQIESDKSLQKTKQSRKTGGLSKSSTRTVKGKIDFVYLEKYCIYIS